MKKIVIGVLAHVDAGKTTLSEALLYTCGNIRKLGRVDHQDSSLDYDFQERNRGITIYSKEARFSYSDCEFVLVDTPGHADFSAEMERALSVLDIAIVVINGAEGVQAHTKTIWKLLEHYQVPTFVFINKMDMSYLSKETLLNDLTKSLHGGCLEVDSESFLEEVAMTKEEYLNYYLENNDLPLELIQEAIASRDVFPCCFGSALKLEGIEDFLTTLCTYAPLRYYEEDFKAMVYKKSIDDQGNRLTHCKILGGSLKVKTILENGEKVDQIRLYSSGKYEMVEEAFAGEIVSLKGLSNYEIGDFIGISYKSPSNQLASFLSYQIVPTDGTDLIVLHQKLKALNEEDPQLTLTFDTATQEIRVRLMGDIQCEVLQQEIKERFSISVEFTQPRISYKETILEPVEGVGHFEPLRHYAEVHLWMEPLPLGSGLQFESDVPYDTLDVNWQRLVLTHLQEKEHVGVLTGSPITDMRISLIAGKAHLKHTEGGDFRESTYRAIRQGLMEAKSVLLEPYYAFTLTVPTECMSRALFDIENALGSYEISETLEDSVIIQGSAPIRTMQGYQKQVASYTKGKGQFVAEFSEYRPVEKCEDIIKEIGYNPESDINNPSSSVFCAQGAGYYVPWHEVKKNAHLPLREIKKEVTIKQAPRKVHISDEEMERVMRRTFGPERTRLYRPTPKSTDNQYVNAKVVSKTPCIVIDGYNVLFGWDELAEMAKTDLYSARLELMNRICNYQGYKNILTILVFDAYKVKENPGTIIKMDNIYVIYTKEAQTADSYIERVTHDLKHDYQITVITSDTMEQMIVAGNNARRISVREMIIEYEYLTKEFRTNYNEASMKSFNNPLSIIRNMDIESE